MRPPVHVAFENSPALQVTLAADGKYPCLHATTQAWPLGTLLPEHVMVPLLTAGAGEAVHGLAALKANTPNSTISTRSTNGSRQGVAAPPCNAAWFVHKI